MTEKEFFKKYKEIHSETKEILDKYEIYSSWSEKKKNEYFKDIITTRFSNPDVIQQFSDIYYKYNTNRENND